MKKIFISVSIFMMGIMLGMVGYAGTKNAAKQADNFSADQVKEIQQVVHDYLLDNPQIMVEVFRKLQDQQQADMEKRAIQAVHKNYETIFNNPASPVAGNPKGTVTLVEFFDYQCAHCKSMAAVVEELVKQDKTLRVVFKEFPIFPGSAYASRAALAAMKQGKYFEFHNALMADKNPLTKEDVLSTAKKVGLDMERLKKDMQSKAISEELSNNLSLAQTLGLVGTPAFIIQSNQDKKKTFFVPGQVSQDVLQSLIDKANSK